MRVLKPWGYIYRGWTNIYFSDNGSAFSHMYVTLVLTPFANLYDRHSCPRSLRGVLQSDCVAPYSGLITANYADPDVLPNQSLRIVSVTVYLGSAAVVSYSTRPRFVASEALFLFCFHHATADEIGDFVASDSSALSSHRSDLPNLWNYHWPQVVAEQMDWLPEAAL